MDNLHGLLARQLKRHFGSLEAVPEAWHGYIQAVNDAYHAYDTDLAMLERSLEISSNELFQANSDMRALFDALPDLFFRINKDNVIMDCKAGTETQIGEPPEQLIGTSIHDLAVTQVGNKFFNVIRQVRDSDEKATLEYSLRLGEDTKHYEARLLPLPDRQLIIIVRDITARRQAEENRRASERRLQRQHRTLLQLAGSKSLSQGELDQALEDITKAASRALAVERVSVWFFNEDRSKIRCAKLYQRSIDQYESGAELSAREFPAYFNALENDRVIDAQDSYTDPRTHEFADAYLSLHGIGALLDAPIRMGGQPIGVVCHEHVGGTRTWALEDQNFAGSMADVVVLALEIRERLRAQSALSESEDKFRVLAETTDSAIVVFREKILYVNPAMEYLSGYGEADLLTKDWGELVHQEFQEHIWEMGRIWHDEDVKERRFEIKILTKDGEERWLYCSSASIQYDGRPAGLITAFDISERKLVEEQLRHEAFHDKLTGLPNRALFAERLQIVFDRARSDENYRFAVLFLDLDRFKVLNDSLGHKEGDRMLLETATRLQSVLRPHDTVARLGGDEFTILLNDIKSVNSATHVAERIQEVLSRPYLVSGREVFISASIGIALNDNKYVSAELMLRDADIAMYRAKAKGKACHELFDSNMHARAFRLLELETDLRMAIERNEFRLYYQPIINLRSGDLAGFEALLRWCHPERGVVPPLEFIPLAEETGMIVPIGRWVILEACRQLKAWQLQGEFSQEISVSVNISSKQLVPGELADYFAKVLLQTGVSADSLKIELTESMIMDSPEATTSVLNELRDLGIEVYVDDFGTGYSSLSYLHRFPLDTLKIDRSFVSMIGERGENATIVNAIVALAHNLQLEVIAEGIEHEWQLRHLRTIGCDKAQGFRFAKPMPVEELQHWSAVFSNDLHCVGAKSKC